MDWQKPVLMDHVMAAEVQRSTTIASITLLSEPTMVPVVQMEMQEAIRAQTQAEVIQVMMDIMPRQEETDLPIHRLIIHQTVLVAILQVTILTMLVRAEMVVMSRVAEVVIPELTITAVHQAARLVRQVVAIIQEVVVTPEVLIVGQEVHPLTQTGAARAVVHRAAQAAVVVLVVVAAVAAVAVDQDNSNTFKQLVLQVC